MKELSLKDGWLQRRLDKSRAEVDSWSKLKGGRAREHIERFSPCLVFEGPRILECARAKMDSDSEGAYVLYEQAANLELLKKYRDALGWIAVQESENAQDIAKKVLGIEDF